MPPAMPQPDDPIASSRNRFFRKLLGRPSSSTSSSPARHDSGDERAGCSDETSKPSLIRRMSRRVVPSLPRPQTFRRQLSERRESPTPVEPAHADERRAASVDRRSRRTSGRAASQTHTNPRASAPSLVGEGRPSLGTRPVLGVDDATDGDDDDGDGDIDINNQAMHDGMDEIEDDSREHHNCSAVDEESLTDVHSMTASEYEAMIRDELEHVWILNLSMHFQDRSKREKFFVTYREHEHLWRRVTISLDYHEASPSSLEHTLARTKYQRDKSAKIYEAIRESLPDIQFYDTVTNLKLETTDGRLHVHVVEDGNEIIHFPSVDQIRHLGCKRIREGDILFDSHMSGFVYKVRVKGQTLIKKEIPSPETVDEFLYEVNALSSLGFSKDVIHFHGVVVDDFDEHVKGLLISYAEQGALIDVIFDNSSKHGKHAGLAWSIREKWSRQIVQGLADIHESGFVQGDFTLSNIVIDQAGNAKIIDINRRGCPVGWEPPEATALIETNQRLSMYIGVKSDLYQLGMVLWGLAMMDEEPEAHGRPLMLGPEISVPDWYRQVTEICLSDDPRERRQASTLLHMFPCANNTDEGMNGLDGGPVDVNMGMETREPSSADDSPTLHDYELDGYQTHVHHPATRTVESSNGWSRSNTTYVDSEHVHSAPYYHARGRSPPSPPSHFDGFDAAERASYYRSAWAANRDIPSSYSDSGGEEEEGEEAEEAEGEREKQVWYDYNEDYDAGETLPDAKDGALREPTPTPTGQRVSLQGPGLEAEQASIQTSLSASTSTNTNSASEKVQEAIEVKIVNVDSCKNLSIVRREVVGRASKSESPGRHKEKTKTGRHAARSSSSSQRPRVVEVTTPEPEEEESETEPESEYTTSQPRGRKASQTRRDYHGDEGAPGSFAVALTGIGMGMGTGHMRLEGLEDEKGMMDEEFRRMSLREAKT